MTPRLAIVGYGSAGRNFHGYLLSLCPALTVRGFVSRTPETRAKILAEQPGKIAYASLEEALADGDVDGVVLASPHDTHHPYAIQAFRAGKHVITDKPVALTLVQLDEMYAAADAAGKQLLVFHNRRWDYDYLTLKREMAAGTLGDCRWIETAWNRFGFSKAWRASADRGGGRLYDLGAHMIDQILTLFPDEIASVHCRAHYDFKESDTVSHCLVTIAFATGKTGIVDVNSMSRYEKPRMLAMGEKGTIVFTGVDPQEAAMLKGNIDMAELLPDRWPMLIVAGGPEAVEPVAGRWRSFYEHAAEVLTGKVEPLITRRDMRRLMMVLDAAHASIRRGETIRVS